MPLTKESGFPIDHFNGSPMAYQRTRDLKGILELLKCKEPPHASTLIKGWSWTHLRVRMLEIKGVKTRDDIAHIFECCEYVLCNIFDPNINYHLTVMP